MRVESSRLDVGRSVSDAGNDRMIMSTDASKSTISERLARFAAGLRYEDIPPAVLERAKYLILDAIGIALASTRQEYARAAFEGLAMFGSGNGVVIGIRERLPVRDAIVMNGVLVHGLDYDDTHPEGVVHSTSSCFPCAFGVASHASASGRDLLAAFVLGTEVAARLGMVARGALHEAGFHPTGMLAAFSGALIAGKLYGLSEREMVMAQGIAPQHRLEQQPPVQPRCIGVEASASGLGRCRRRDRGRARETWLHGSARGIRRRLRALSRTPRAAFRKLRSQCCDR